jgi:glycosyltransferase involved in cell wall biosynthesis
MTRPDPRARRRVELCFVAPKAYSQLSGDPRVRHIGGAEVQQCLLAKGLARRGRPTSMVTLDVGQGDERTFDGVLALRSYRLDTGWPGLRFFWPRITGLWTAMRRADAAVYYQRTSDSLTGVVAAFCRRYGRRFVYAAGEDGDCLPSLPNCGTARERVLYRYGLRRADLVVAQTRWQRDALARNFGVPSIQVKSAAPDPGEPAPLPREGRPRFLWAGRFAAQKRPELLIELARRCPEADFDVVGGESSGGPDAVVTDAARCIPNLHLHGFVPNLEMGPLYAGALALVCTSVREGFPNTFLEAWSRARPVLTTVDPDGVVAEEGVGLVATDILALVEAVREMSAAGEAWTAMAGRARAYYVRAHQPDRILDDYEALLDGLASQERDVCNP